jgi:hypothetical protein
MRRIFGILAVLLFSVVLSGQVKAADRDDHDDKAPVQSGYAIVTVLATTGGTATGLVVFETYGMRGGPDGTSQAGVLPPDLTTNSLLFVDSEGRLSKNLGVAIVNPNDSDTSVTLTLRKGDGTQLATGTLNVPKHQQISKFVTQLFSGPSAVPSDVIGTLAITSAGTSNLPVSVIGLRFRGPNFSTLPVTNLAPVTPAPASASTLLAPGAVLLPQFAAGGGWATELVLGNTNGSPMNVRVDLYKQDGTPLSTSLNGTTASSFTGLTIPANGVLVLAPRDIHGDDDF